MRKFDFYDKPKSFATAIVTLIGHLVGTAGIFVSLIFLGWGVAFILHFLNEIQNFPPQILLAFAKFELYLTYFDIALCILVLFAGARRFYLDLKEIL